MHRSIKLVGTASLSVQMLCLFTLATGQPVLAEDGGLAGQIAQSEMLMFGHPSTGMSAQLRVEALETNIFGQPGSGSLNDRLKKINQALGLTGSAGTASTAAISPAKKRATTGTASTAAVSAVKKPATIGTAASAIKNKSKTPFTLQPMTAQTDMPVVAPNRNGTADPALPPVAPQAVKSPVQLLQLGTKRFTEGNYAEADSLFHQVLAHDPNNADALYNLGALAERRGDLGSALNFYRTALTLKPSDSDLKQAVASVQQQLGTSGATAVNADQKGPFKMPQRAGQPLMGGVFDSQQLNAGPSFNGTAMQPSLGQQPLVGTVVGQGQGNVTQPPIGLANVTQPSVGVGTVKQPGAGKSILKQVFHTGVSVGVSQMLPGPLSALHCPLCSLLNSGKLGP